MTRPRTRRLDLLLLAILGLNAAMVGAQTTSTGSANTRAGLTPNTAAGSSVNTANTVKPNTNTNRNTANVNALPATPSSASSTVPRASTTPRATTNTAGARTTTPNMNVNTNANTNTRAPTSRSSTSASTSPSSSGSSTRSTPRSTSTKSNTKAPSSSPSSSTKSTTSSSTTMEFQAWMDLWNGESGTVKAAGSIQLRRTSANSDTVMINGAFLNLEPGSAYRLFVGSFGDVSPWSNKLSPDVSKSSPTLQCLKLNITADESGKVLINNFPGKMAGVFNPSHSDFILGRSLILTKSKKCTLNLPDSIAAGIIGIGSKTNTVVHAGNEGGGSSSSGGKRMARAYIRPVTAEGAKNGPRGTVNFQQDDEGSVSVSWAVEKLKPNTEYSILLTAMGDLNPNVLSSRDLPRYNPTKVDCSSSPSQGPVGELGSFKTDGSGNFVGSMKSKFMSLDTAARYSILGRGIMITGKIDTCQSSGIQRLAVGVIGSVNPTVGLSMPELESSKPKTKSVGGEMNTMAQGMNSSPTVRAPVPQMPRSPAPSTANNARPVTSNNNNNNNTNTASRSLPGPKIDITKAPTLMDRLPVLQKAANGTAFNNSASLNASAQNMTGSGSAGLKALSSTSMVVYLTTVVLGAVMTALV